MTRYLTKRGSGAMHMGVCILAAHLTAMAALAAEDLQGPYEDTVDVSALAALDAAEQYDPAKWFWLFALVNTHPKLESEEPIRRYFNPAMRTLAPTFDDVYTIGDLRDDYLIWPPHFGVGRVLSPHWTLFFQCGYSAGKVRTKATDPSILLFPLHTDFEIKRGAAYAGLGLDFLPLGQVEQKERTRWRERFLGARPVVGFRYTYVYALYEAKVKVGFKPFGNIISYKQDDAWLVSSFGLNLGVDVPLTRRTHLTCNAGYNFFLDRAYDFDGPAYTVGVKRYF